MVEVTEADREAAKKFLQRNLLERPSLSNQTEAVLRNAFATHRIEAAKAERDRLRELAKDKGFLSVEDIEQALESQP